MTDALVELKSGNKTYAKRVTAHRGDILRFASGLAKNSRKAKDAVLVHFAEESAPVRVRA